MIVTDVGQGSVSALNGNRTAIFGRVSDRAARKRTALLRLH